MVAATASLEAMTSDPHPPTVRRLQGALHGLVVVLLAVAAVRGLVLGSSPALVTLASVVLLGWYAVGAGLARRAAPAPASDAGAAGEAERGGRRSSALVWMGVLVGLWAVVVLVASPEFSWLAFPFILIGVLVLPPLVAHPLAALMTAVVVVAQLRGAGPESLRAGMVLGPVLGALVAIGTGAAYLRVLRESEDRRRLVEQLVAAQDDLVAVHDELAATQREAGVATERTRIARDIHDTLAQGLSSIVLLSRAAAADPASREPLLAQIEATAVDNLEEARRVVAALTPSALEQAPLPAAIGRLLERLGAQSGIRTTLHVDGDARTIPTTVEVALLRVAQSALANVRLHSGASRVVVTISYADTSVSLDVLDDGRGFDESRLASAPLGGTGFGLRAMRSRLTELGGRLDVETAPGDGTAIAATVPLSTPQGQEQP